MKNWEKNLEPLLQKYGKQKHPLDYKNTYQFVAMIILAAQTNDNLINKIAPNFFKAVPSIKVLKEKSPEELYPLLSTVIGFRKKSQWLTDMARAVGDDSKIPGTIKELTKLPGIGRKTANAIIRESGNNAEGIMVDLHVIRVATRLGITDDKKPEKIEKDLMEALPQKRWNETGMALSFHGREICRPKPKCEECSVNKVCEYYASVIKTKT